MKRLFLFSIVILGLIFAAIGLGQDIYYYGGTEIRSTAYNLPCAGPGIGFTGDVNDDGFWDLVVAAAPDYSDAPIPQDANVELKILINDGNNLFSDETDNIISGPVTTFAGMSNIFLADFNGDNRTDIFLIGNGYDNPPFPGEQHYLLLSTPDGHLVDVSSSNLPGYSQFTPFAAIGDIDSDGDIDVYVGNRMFLINDGFGEFTENTSQLPASLNPEGRQDFDPAIADMNGDGHPDLISGTGSTVGNIHPTTIFYNDGTGNFSDDLRRDLPYGAIGEFQQVSHVFPTDLNGDGLLDLMLAQGDPHATDLLKPDRSIQILIQMSDGSFIDESNLRIANGEAYKPDESTISFFAPIDFDSDGDIDIYFEDAMTDSPDDPVILLNDGTGHFTMVFWEAFDGISGFMTASPLPSSRKGLADFVSYYMDQNTMYFQTFKGGMTPSLVSSTYPINYSTDEAVNIKISATFSEAMDPSTITSDTFW